MRRGDFSQLTQQSASNEMQRALLRHSSQPVRLHKMTPSKPGDHVVGAGSGKVEDACRPARGGDNGFKALTRVTKGMANPSDETPATTVVDRARLRRGPGRPRSSNAEPSARDQILESATALFCRFGINAIGIDSIVEAAGVSKTTLYNIFGSKEALIHDVLAKAGQDWRQDLFAAIDAHTGDPTAKLLAIFDRLEEWFGDPDYFGCPFINAVGEHDKFDNTMRNIALAHKKIVLHRIVALAEEAQFEDAAGVAHQFAVIIDGAIVAALITRDPLIAHSARQAAQAVLERQSVRAANLARALA